MEDMTDYESYAEPITEVSSALRDEENMDRQLTILANTRRPVRIPSKGATKEDIRNAFNTAFELIGGVPRLALWANENPDKFYAIFSKLHGNGAGPVSGKLIVEHTLKRNKLDEVTIDDQGRVINVEDSNDTV